MMYIEPDDYIPKEIRKKLKLGEFNDETNNEEQEQREKDNQELRDVINNEK